MFGFSSTIGAAALSTVLVASVSQPAWAAATQIVGVEVKDTSEGIELVLKQARPGDRPQVFSVERGSSWVADIINSQLVLPEGGNFQSLNPAPGIASIQVVALDANSVRLIVTGEGGAPSGQLSDRNPQGLSFSFVAGSGAAASGGRSAASAPVAQSPAPSNRAQPEVLVPNPEITITGGQPTAIPRQNPAPPFLPRAVAPPLGDIAVSELAPTVQSIDLGTVERVPRLVLRDAPAREVLALLARAAGLNLAFMGDAAGGAAPEGQAAAAGGEGPAVTLDIENEPVQDVFNYVLRLTNLKAVRQGQTILVGATLPDAVQSRNTIVRTLRVNQADAAAVANFLVAQGAEARLVETVTTRTIENEGSVNQSVKEEQTTQVTTIAPQDSTNGAPAVLRGLTVVTDSRLNSVTLVGEPSVVDLATSFSKQLDLRQRQVAVNVKIVDVTLDNTSSFSSDFSFGIGDTFFVSDGGAATVNFGPYQPSSSTTAQNNFFTPPIINNPASGFPSVIDLSQTITVPTTGIGQTIVNPDGSVTRIPNPPADFFGRQPSLSNNPLSPGGISSITQGTPDRITQTLEPETTNVITRDPDTGLPVVTEVPTGRDVIVSAVTQGAVGAISQQLFPSLIRYPSQFLTRLNAQVVSGNAKVLTDPTLVVQESQTAAVNLTDKVLTEVQENVTAVGDTSQVSREYTYEDVGLILSLSINRIDDNGFITMEIQPRVSTVVGTQAASLSNGQVQQLNVIGKRELNSGKIRLRDGQTLVVAGIIQETERENTTKWPILGDLPIVGTLFRNTSSERDRSEVVIVVTPQIMDDSDRSNFGYDYTPGPEAQELLDRRR